MSALITFKELQTATGCTRQSQVEEVLRKNGITFLYGKNGIFTTLDAVNAAMGLAKETQQENKIELM